MPQSWSQSLVRASLSEWLVDDAIREANGAIVTEVEAVLRAEIETPSQVTALKKALASVKCEIASPTFEALTEELNEIRNDLKWIKSGRGKYVSTIQDWGQSFHAEMRQITDFDDLYVGGHASLEVVYIVGKAKSEEILNQFIEFILSKNPPRKIMTQVEIKES